MAAQVPGKVVLHVGDGVVHGVVPGKELVTQGDVVVGADAVSGNVTVQDVDEGELVGVGAADVVQLGEGGQELVGQVVGETAVQVQGPGVHDILHGIHGVGVGHGVLGHTGAAHTGTAVHRGAVGAVPDVVLGVVVAQGQLVLLADVPVQTGQDLDVVLVGREVGPGAGVVAILVFHELGNLLQVGVGGTGDEVVGIGHAVGGAFPAVHDGGNLDVFGVHEEEELVLHDGAAQGKTVSGAAVLIAGTGDLFAVHGVTLHVFILMIDVCGALEGVGTRLGDGVHAAADEVGLTNVVGADDNLKFLDGVDGDGVATAREVGGKTEVVVEVGTVHGKVGGTAVGTGETHAVTAVGRQTGNIRDVAVDGGHGLNLTAVDVGHGAVNGTGGLMQSHHGCADDRFAALVHHLAGEGRRGHLSIGYSARNQCTECEQKAFKSVSHKRMK